LGRDGEEAVYQLHDMTTDQTVTVIIIKTTTDTQAVGIRLSINDGHGRCPWWEVSCT